MKRKDHGFSLISMLLSLVIIGIVLYFVVFPLLETQEKNLKENPQQKVSKAAEIKSAQDKVKQINELSQKRDEQYKKYLK